VAVAANTAHESVIAKTNGLRWDMESPLRSAIKKRCDRMFPRNNADSVGGIRLSDGATVMRKRARR
jgi:hypothetical protein